MESDQETSEIMMNETGFIYDADTIQVKIEKCKKHIAIAKGCMDPGTDYVSKNRIEWENELEKWMNHVSMKRI